MNPLASFASLIRRRTILTVFLALLASLLYVSVAAAISLFGPRKDDRGITFSHKIHVSEVQLDCADCHGFEANRFGLSTTALPPHEVCGVCHTIDEAAPDQSCRLCHTKSDYAVSASLPALKKEVIFDHDPHITAQVDCATCHDAPDKHRLPKGNLMQFCMDCHQQRPAPALNECATCHTEITRDTKPAFRGLARINHDVPAIWERRHGHEFQIDAQFCGYCHDDQQAFCEDCHRQTKPQSHTVAWKRRTHGIHAGWDRQSCAVCHEEDSCERCHQNSQPASHRRAGFQSPADRHCVQCHLPEQNNTCIVCHERIEHATAPRSPHDLGVFPPNCARCHPGGNPFRAPHPVNSTTRCAECHRR